MRFTTALFSKEYLEEQEEQESCDSLKAELNVRELKSGSRRRKRRSERLSSIKVDEVYSPTHFPPVWKFH